MNSERKEGPELFTSSTRFDLTIFYWDLNRCNFWICPNRLNYLQICGLSIINQWNYMLVFSSCQMTFVRCSSYKFLIFLWFFSIKSFDCLYLRFETLIDKKNSKSLSNCCSIHWHRSLLKTRCNLRLIKLDRTSIITLSKCLSIQWIWVY